jgi:hypothetical protein
MPSQKLHYLDEPVREQTLCQVPVTTQHAGMMHADA